MKQKNMNKHGFFLAEETLKIILAVIVIGFLIYFLVSLYFSNADEENMQFAESSAKYIIEQMNAQTKEIQIFNPDGWIITAWTAAQEMPLQCSNLGWKNCICICKDDANIDIRIWKNTDLDDCNDKSYCLEYNKEIFINEGSLKIDNSPITLEINYGDKIEVNKK
jgi:hypothetical protein